MSRELVRLRLEGDRRRRLLHDLRTYFEEHFDETLSDFRAEGLVDFLITAVGPPLYNQGVRDACAAMQEKLLDLEGEVYEVERTD